MRTQSFMTPSGADVGDFVRTSPLFSFDEGFLFQTFRTFYVLLGDGVRKRADLETVGRIF